ncbi:MAG: hypothetical protein A2535_07360 [Burkholderiales bacterium RIFOXYD2_FULL_59_8]|nr:MAG: hypothetical protein A2535_07360 [Burkholderiales bacterium RIFOXYD2_FULL_59_8]
MVARAFALLANFSNVLSIALRTDQPGNVRAMVLMHNSPEMLLPTDVDGALAYRELGGFFDQGQRMFVAELLPLGVPYELSR